MHTVQSIADGSKAAVYRQLHEHMSALFADERSGLANTANMSALLYDALPNLNWAGFYFLQGRELVLGPFQGKVACVRIALGFGVCGTAAERRETVIVPDVHAFPGARFDHDDRAGLIAAVDLLLQHTDFTRIADAGAYAVV